MTIAISASSFTRRQLWIMELKSQSGDSGDATERFRVNRQPQLYQIPKLVGTGDRSSMCSGIDWWPAKWPCKPPPGCQRDKGARTDQCLCCPLKGEGATASFDKSEASPRIKTIINWEHSPYIRSHASSDLQVRW